MADTIEVDAQVIDSPQLLSGADMWLADVSQRVAAKAAEYTPFDITTKDEYRDAKRIRTALRKDISEIDSERKSQTRAIKDAVRKFELGCHDVLQPLTDAEDEYRRRISEYEAQMVDERRMRLAEEYAEMAPDLVPLVPFDRLCEHFAKDGKWLNLSTPEAKASESLAEAVQRIANDESVIASTAADAEEEREVRAEYFTTLDVSAALRSCIARREQRKRVAELDYERKARETCCEPRCEPVEPEPERAPKERPSEPQTASERLIVFEVTVPESKARAFRDAMLAIGGIHGRVIR